MESIPFQCTLCGECCSGSMKVFVNSYDLYKMGRFLKMHHSGELFNKGFVILDHGQNGLRLPRIQFKTKPFPFCPFLINDFQEEKYLRGLCSLHLEHKPLVCRLAPLYRELDLNKERDIMKFILPHPSCPGRGGEMLMNPQKEQEILKEELEFEKRYYRLLSRTEKNPSFLWNFSLERPFSQTQEEWEK